MGPTDWGPITLDKLIMAAVLIAYSVVTVLPKVQALFRRRAGTEPPCGGCVALMEKLVALEGKVIKLEVEQAASKKREADAKQIQLTEIMGQLLAEMRTRHDDRTTSGARPIPR